MSVYRDVSSVGTAYMGPEAELFIGRQCALYLNIHPQGLAKEHLPVLAKWMGKAGARLLDPARAKEMAAKIAAL